MMIQRQVWNDKVRYLIADEYGSVMVELYDEPQQWGEHYGTAWIWGLVYLPPTHAAKDTQGDCLKKLSI